ncbi:hypothetical protein CI238_13566 [Colletotrichum incanum]|uniref:Uncharacterized protein n=1 Tax=Colletotrichum incanum TaxID=1573173 RepID=A0A167E6M4_COLIC|nr:hypothetical protein CI238_13566 [Colletotrichum incanum]
MSFTFFYLQSIRENFRI